MDLVRLLVARGADVNAMATENGWTPLHVAVKTGVGRCDVVELLVARGADPGLTDCFGNTPLALAVKLGPNQRAVAELLRKLVR
jgi:ankyrin repeat protein